MNWLLVLAVLLVAGNIVWGFSRGFLRVVYSVIAWICILILVTFATPYVTDWLTEHTSIDDSIESSMKEKLHEMVIGEASTEGTEEIPENDSDKTLEDLSGKLPDVIMDRFLDSGKMTDGLLEDSGVYGALASRASQMAMRAIAFVAVLLFAMIAFHILSVMLDLVGKLPVIGEVNHLLGGVAGFVKGILLVWLALAFVAMGSATEVGMALVQQIYESPFLIWFYENNFVLTILMYFL